MQASTTAAPHTSIESRRSRRFVAPALLLMLAIIAAGVAGLELPSFSSEPPTASVAVRGAAPVVRVGVTTPPGELSFLAVDPVGNLTVSDRRRRSVLRFNVTGAAVGEWGPTLNGVTIVDPAGVALAGETTYVVDRGDPRIIALGSNGQVQRVIGLQSYGTYGLNGLSVDPAGNLVVADTGRNRLLIFSPDGRLVKESGKGGKGLGEFTQPMALAYAADGGLVIADWENSRIQRWAADLTPVIAWNTPMRPFGVAVDTVGRVYVPDNTRARVQVYSPRGTLLTELGGGPPAMDLGPSVQLAYAAGSRSVLALAPDRVTRIDLEEVAPPPTVSGPAIPGVATLGLVALLAVVGTLVVERQVRDFRARRGAAASSAPLVGSAGGPPRVHPEDAARGEQQEPEPYDPRLVEDESKRHQQPGYEYDRPVQNP